ncbi:hypothetical protein FQR65_LT16647 [Abscondita terminalis]|nr:hypothetical protein FQR65_LT16647 [Abscondita terminalis]
MSVTQAVLDGYGVSKASGDAREAGGVTINGVTPAGVPVTSIDANKWYTSTGGIGPVTSNYIYDGTVVRLRELTLGYDFNIKQGFPIKKLKVSAVTQSVLYFKKAPLDPEKGKILKLLTIAEVVLQSSPNSATNDSTRGYSINPTYAELIRNYGKKDWEKSVKDKLKNIEPLSQKLKRERQISKVEVTLPSGGQLTFSAGEHNDLQKAIIEDFLPRYGFGAEVLYVGDTTDKYLYLEKDKLEKLNFFEISHEELPDVIAYSKKKNWLYLIEAVHSSGSISEIRLLQLQKLTKKR